MPRQGWKGISIPVDQYNDLAIVVEENHQYASVTEVVRAAIAMFLKERR